MLDYIVRKVNILQAPITHKVRKHPGKGLSSEKWDELFLPMLKGYVKKEKFQPWEYVTWQKTYEPESSVS